MAWIADVPDRRLCHVATRIRLASGNEITVALSGKRVSEALTAPNAESLVRFKTPAGVSIWVNPNQVALVEDRPDLD